MDLEQRETSVYCPYCGEQLSVLLDPSAGDQQYIEDCQVCCQPIEFDVTLDHTAEPRVAVRSDRD